MRFVPVWQDAADEAHPPTRASPACSSLVVDVAELTGGVTRDIRSGKTGYAWVIDGNGTFLHHQEAFFIGKSAFEARTAKMPTISFDRINEIQKTLMLAGKEGTSWYISGWHLGVEGRVRKLIAYAPIRSPRGEAALWSVAVVARSRVEGRSTRSGARPDAAGGDHRGLRARHRDHHLADGALRRTSNAGRPPDSGIPESSSGTAPSWRTPGTSSSPRTGPDILSINAYGAKLSGADGDRQRNLADLRLPHRRGRCWPSTGSSRQEGAPDHPPGEDRRARTLAEHQLPQAARRGGEIYARHRHITDRRQIEATTTPKLARSERSPPGGPQKQPLVILGFTDLLSKAEAPGRGGAAHDRGYGNRPNRRAC
jgi:hypothetical protein